MLPESLMLDAVEVRVLGSLLEKEITTPEYYPLTLNALVAACNQKSSREPVVSYDEETVAAALESLRHKGLAIERTGAGMRVPKYAQRFTEAFNMGRRETAVICVLMLRGPQTVGELRDRTLRMHQFDDIAEVEACLDRLMAWQPGPLVARLERQPGMKEPRYAQLLGGEPPAMQPAAPSPAPTRDDRIAALEAEVGALRDDVERLRQEWAEFRKLFE